MLRGPLHNRGADGLCEACGQPFPCPTGIAIYETIKRDLESTGSVSTPTGADTPETPDGPPPPNWTPPEVRWEALEDREYRCPRCLHWWVSHGVPAEDGYGCSIPTSSMDERERGIYETCDCTFALGNAVTPHQVRMQP